MLIDNNNTTWYKVKVNGRLLENKWPSYELAMDYIKKLPAELKEHSEVVPATEDNKIVLLG